MKLTPEEISWLDHYVLSIYCRKSGKNGIPVRTEAYYVEALEFIRERRRAFKIIEDLPEEE